MAQKSILRILLILFIGLLSGSCKQEAKQGTFRHFPAEYSLHPKFIELDEMYVGGSVMIYDTLYFLTNTPNDTFQIHIYNQNFKYLGSGGMVGKGPGEIINPFMTRIDRQEGVLWFADMGRQELLKFPVDTLVKNHQFLPWETVPIPEDLWFITLYDPLPDNLFSFADYQSTYDIISFFNKDGERIDSLRITRNPDLLNLKSRYEQDVIPTFSYEFHPEKDIFALAYVYSDILVILDSKGEIITMVQGPDEINQVPDVRDDNRIWCYSQMQVDERYIYLLYRGKPIIDAQRNLNIPNQIFVFDWNAQPVASLLLDHPISRFTLDKVSRKFISLSIETGDIVIYDIPEELYY